MARRPCDRVIKQVLFAHALGGCRNRVGRIGSSWRDIAHTDIIATFGHGMNWYNKAQNRVAWKKAIDSDLRRRRRQSI